MKKLFGVLTILIACTLATFAAAQGQKIILIPEEGSEILDNVTVTTSADGSGQIIQFKKTITENKGGYEITVDTEKGTYKAIKEEFPSETEQEILKMNPLDSLTITYSYPANLVAYLETHEPLNWKLASSYLNAQWSFSQRAGESDAWVWDAFPSEIGTHWYIKKLLNDPVVYTPHRWRDYMHSHTHAWHQNKDFGIGTLRTNVYHDIYIDNPLFHGWCIAEPAADVTSTVEYTGEAWQLLHTHLYYYWISRLWD